jgi:hypothetical protein
VPDISIQKYYPRIGEDIVYLYLSRTLFFFIHFWVHLLRVLKRDVGSEEGAAFLYFNDSRIPSPPP